jgi:hypothetical protein
MEFAVLAGESDPVLFRQGFSYLTHVEQKRVERSNDGAVLRVLERRKRVYVSVDDDSLAAIRQCLQELRQRRLVAVELYDEGPAADFTCFDGCPVVPVAPLGSSVPNCARRSRPECTPSASSGTTRWSTGCGPRGAACGRSPATWAWGLHATWQELADGRWQGPCKSKLDPFKPYLDQHADASRGSILRLFREIKALGYDGSYPVVRDYLDRHRPAREPLPPAPPTVRDVTGWLTRRPDSLAEDERPRLKAILDRCLQLQAASDQVRAFAAMRPALHRHL